MLNTITFSVTVSSLRFWLSRLKRFNIPHKDPIKRFNKKTVVYLEDMDGLGLEIVFNDNDTRPGSKSENIPQGNSIKGFYNVEIWEEGFERTAGLLTELLDQKLRTEKGNRIRFAASDTPGNYVDVLCSPDSLKGLAGSGTIHHLAFKTPGIQAQQELRLKILKRMLNPTPILDRNYFTSFIPGNPEVCCSKLLRPAPVLPRMKLPNTWVQG